jgi:hypothetical protein
MQPERPLHIVKAWMRQVYVGNLAFKQCEVSKSELFTTERLNRSKAQKNPLHIFSNQVMWAKVISHPWNHKQQKQNTDESITLLLKTRSIVSKSESLVFIITIKPNNTRKKQKAVGRFSGKSILLQLIMEKTHEQLQMCKKFLRAKHTTLCQCKETHFFAVMIICWGAKLLPSCHHRERISDSQFPSIVSLQSHIIYIPSKQTAGINKQYTNFVTNSRSLSYGFSLSTPMACKFVFPMEEEDLREVFIQARAQTSSPQFQRDIQVSIH